MHLVLNGAYDISILLAQFRAFSVLPIEDLVITHLDEETSWGKLWNLVLGTNCSIRHFSAGQNIPGDLCEASANLIFARQFPGKQAGNRLARQLVRLNVYETTIVIGGMLGFRHWPAFQLGRAKFRADLSLACLSGGLFDAVLMRWWGAAWRKGLAESMRERQNSAQPFNPPPSFPKRVNHEFNDLLNRPPPRRRSILSTSGNSGAVTPRPALAAPRKTAWSSNTCRWSKPWWAAWP